MTEEEIKAMIAEAVADKDAEISRLKSKNDELIGKNKKIRDEADSAKSAAESAREDAERKAGDVEALEKTLNTRYSKQIADLTSERDSALKSFQDSQVKTAIQTAFAQHNVLPDAHEMVEAFFSTRVQHADGVATVDGKPSSEALAEYFKSDKAKPFIAASASAGVGPKLNAGKASTFSDEKWSIDAYAKMKTADPAAAAAWAEANGNGYLNRI